MAGSHDDTPTDRIIYFDNAATSWPKPQPVVDAMCQTLTGEVGNPGRSGHKMSLNAARIVMSARMEASAVFCVMDPDRIVFTRNVTEALNLAIYGLVKAGDHVVTSSMEHNSVMRPLRHLESLGVSLTVAPCEPDGSLNPEDVRAAIRPETTLVVTTHASNVTGTIVPIEKIASICRSAGVPYLVDAAQTAGVREIDVEQMGVDLLAFTGHKGLLGPTGTGGLIVADGIDLPPLLRGGTGSRSSEECQPDFLPDRLESGTANVVGLAGLAAGIQYLQRTGIDSVARHEQELVKAFLDGSSRIPGMRVFGPTEPRENVGTLSFRIDGMSTSEVGQRLEEEAGVMCRIGLHCAPGAHRTLGTFPDGTVRFGFGLHNTLDEVNTALDALDRMARSNTMVGSRRAL